MIKSKFLFALALIAYQNAFAGNCIPDVYAMSPQNMTCDNFATSCDIPNGWIVVESCNITDLGKEQSDSMNWKAVSDIMKNSPLNSTAQFPSRSPNGPMPSMGNMPLPNLQLNQDGAGSSPKPGGMRFYMQ